MELVGTTAGIIITLIVAAVGLMVLIGGVFIAARQQEGRGRSAPGGEELTEPAHHAQISPGQGDHPWQRTEDRHVPEGGHPHGKRSSWVLVAVVTAAFVAGGLAIILHAWPLLWACIGVVVLSIPAGKVIGIMNDTVAWGSSPAATADRPRAAEVRSRPSQPHYTGSEPRSLSARARCLPCTSDQARRSAMAKNAICR